VRVLAPAAVVPVVAVPVVAVPAVVVPAVVVPAAAAPVVAANSDHRSLPDAAPITRWKQLACDASTLPTSTSSRHVTRAGPSVA